MGDQARGPAGTVESQHRESYRRLTQLVVGARNRDETVLRVLNLLAESLGTALAAIARDDGEVLRLLRCSEAAGYDIRDGDAVQLRGRPGGSQSAAEFGVVSTAVASFVGTEQRQNAGLPAAGTCILVSLGYAAEALLLYGVSKKLRSGERALLDTFAAALADLRARQDERSAADDDLRRATRALNAIISCNQAIVRASSELELLTQGCEAITAAGGYRLAWVGYALHDQTCTVQPIAWAGEAAAYLQAITVTWSDTPSGRGPVGTAIRTAQPVVWRNVALHSDFKLWQDTARVHGLAANATFPLLVEGTVIGALAIYAAEPHAFDDAEEQLLQGLADALAYGIAARRASGEREQAVNALRATEERFRVIFEQAAVGIAQVAPDGQWLLVNDRLCEILGYPREELLRLTFLDITHPDDLPQDRTNLQRMGAGDVSSLAMEKRYIRKDASVVWTAVTVAAVRDEHGKEIYRVTIIEDITARKYAQEALRQAAAENDLLAAAVETATTGVVVTDATHPDNPIIYMNPAYLTMTGYNEEEVVGRNPRFLQGGGTDQKVRNEIRNAIRRQVPWSGTVLNYHKTGAPIWSELRITPILDEKGKLRNWVGLKTDVTERVLMEEKLQHLALHDHLTALPNRALLLDRAAQALLHARRQGAKIALLLLDLDHFKEVNDTFGHSTGDALLQKVAERLRNSLRATDTVARLGGDEFAVLLPATDQTGAITTAETLLETLGKLFAVNGTMLRATASIGIAVFPDHGTDEQALLQHADVAMYEAKRAHASPAVYAPEKDLHSPDRLAFFEELRDAVAAGRLLLHYQPIVALADGALLAVEALVRWPHPRRGLVPPDAFLPPLERLGLLGTLTRWVLREALDQQRRWRLQGLDVAMNINFAAPNLHDEALVDDLAALLSERAGTPVQLTIELTEGALVADLAQTRATLMRLAALGARIAIDDYGTGYSSLSRLARLPVNELKIDRSFIQRMVTDAVDAAIVSSTVGLGHSLDMRLVAEGVEDERTLQRLRQVGCDAVQGFVIARPMPPDALERWLRQCPTASHAQ